MKGKNLERFSYYNISACMERLDVANAEYLPIEHDMDTSVENLPPWR